MDNFRQMSENARADAEERTAQARAEVEQLRESLRKHKKKTYVL